MSYYFKEQVFDDTTYNVVSFHYLKKNKENTFDQKIKFTFFPDNKEQIFTLKERFGYSIAGAEVEVIEDAPSLKIVRLTDKLCSKYVGETQIKCYFGDVKTTKIFNINDALLNKINHSIILLHCIDTNTSLDGRIKASDIRDLDRTYLVGKETSRNLAFILLDNVSFDKQAQMIEQFNSILNSWRERYHSLFLTNFRDNDRKRISFEFCYKLLNYCHQVIS